MLTLQTKLPNIVISFKHIIITRFNLPKRWDKDKKGNEILNNAWLEERFELFENFCVPSIVEQTCKNFEWWVYFDENTGSIFKKRIASIERIYPVFKPRYEKSYDNFERNMPANIYEILKKEDTDWLITTRLDNDDMLAKDTIAILQKKISYTNDCLLEIPWGYTLELNSKPKPKLRKVKLELNPFISYVEKIEKERLIKSVYFYEHTEWKGINSILVSEKPQWAQIIHEKNLFNRISGKLVSPLNFNSRFSYNSSVLKIKPDYKLLTLQLLDFFKMTLISEYVIKIKSFFK